ncbi:MAG: helix-turn-helix domain-containing protein [Flavipsychrobacter sp.]
MKKLAARIKEVRESKGLTLQEVAHAIGKDRQSIHRLEKGEFNPSYIYLSEVCKGLGIELSELVQGL